MKADIAAIRARNEGRRQGGVKAADASAEDIEALLEALDEALEESARLREQYADLHESAMLWANLYSACAAGGTPSPDAPPHVYEYSQLLESIRVLREAIEGFLSDCVRCAPWEVARLMEMTPRELCDRCVRGVTALRRAVNPGDA
jgi:hypothetical protein